VWSLVTRFISFSETKRNEINLLDHERLNVSASVRRPTCIWIQCHILSYSACVLWKLLILEWIIRPTEVWYHVFGRWVPKFWRNLLAPSSEYKVILKMEAAESPMVWTGSNVHKQRPMTLSQFLPYLIINWISAFVCFVIEFECQERMVGCSVENWRTAILT
jgi:hypothetical protein